MLTYRQVKDVYDNSGTDESMEQWANRMNALTGSTAYAAGLSNSWIKNASVNIDRLLEWTGIPDVLGGAGETVGGWVGNPQAGREIGQGLLRGAVDFAPLFVPGLGLAARGASLFGLGAANTYEKTDSPGASVVAGAVNALMPGVASVAEKAALKGMGAEVLAGRVRDAAAPGGFRAISELLPRNLKQGIGGQLAAEGAASAFGEVGNMVQAGLDPNAEYEFDPTRSLLDMTLGQFPFALGYTTQGGMAQLGGQATRDRATKLKTEFAVADKIFEARQAEEDAAQRTPLEKVPEFDGPRTPLDAALLNKEVARLRAQSIALSKDASPDAIVKLRELEAKEEEMLGTTDPIGLDGVLGVKEEADTPRTLIVGTEHWHNPETGYRIIKTPDGKLFGYSTKFEPEAKESAQFPGNKEWMVPDLFSSPVVDNQLPRRVKVKVQDPSQPDLPAQEIETIEYGDYQTPLNELQVKFQNAMSLGELTTLLNEFNTLRQAYSMRPLVDLDFAAYAKKFGTRLQDAMAIEAQRMKDLLNAKKQEEDNIRASIGMDQKGENLGTHSGRLITQRLNVEDDHSIINSLLSDSVFVNTNEYAPEAQSAYAQWLRSKEAVRSGDVTSITNDAKRFMYYWKLKNFQEGWGQGEALTDAEAKLFYDALKKKAEVEGIKLGATPKSLADFASRPHVKFWESQVNAAVLRQQGKSMAPAPTFVPTDPADVLAAAELGLENGPTAQLDWVIRKFPGTPMAGLARDYITLYPELFKRMKSRMIDDSAHYAWVDKNTRIGSVTYGSDLLRMPPAEQAQTILHEATHLITSAEVDNPTNKAIVDKIDALRKRFIASLGPEMTAQIEKLKKERWLDRYAVGEVDYDSLMPGVSDELREIVYAGLTTHEFVSQSLTSPPVIKYLLSQKGDGTTLWKRLVNYIKEFVGIRTLFGKDNFTMFDEMLNYSQALMYQGEHIATFHNYADRFFQQKGYVGDEYLQKSRGALQIVLARAQTPESLVQDANNMLGGMSRSMAKAYKDFKRMGQEDHLALSILGSEAGFTPDSEGLNELVVRATTNLDRTLRDAIETMPDEASKYLFQRLHAVREHMELLQMASLDSKKGLTNLADPDVVGVNATEVIDRIDRVLEIEKLQQVGEKIMLETQKLDPAVYGQLPKEPKYFYESGNPAPFLGHDPKDLRTPLYRRTVDKLVTFLKPIHQYSDPLFKEAAAYGYRLQNNARNWAKAALKNFAIDMEADAADTFTHDGLERVVSYMGNPKVRIAVDKWIYENQKAAQKEGRGVTNLPPTDPKVAQHLQKLTQAEREQAAELLSKHAMSLQDINAAHLKVHGDIANLTAARYLNRVNGGKLQDNLAVADEVWKALQLDWADPTQAAQGQAMLQAVYGKLAPEQAMGLIELQKNALEQHKTLEQFFKENKNWSSAQRTGPLRVTYRKNGERKVGGANNLEDAYQIAGGKANVISIEAAVKPGDEEVPQFGTDYAAVFDRLDELQKTQVDMLKRAGWDQDSIDLMMKTSPVAQFARETAGQGLGVVTAPPRGLRQGAEDLPFLSNHISWIGRQSRFLSRKLFRAQMDAYIDQAEIPDDMKRDLRTHRDNLLQPDPESVKSFNNFVRTWFLGFNVGTNIINAFQTFTTHAPELTAITGKPLDSYRRLKNAMSEVVARKWDKRQWSSPDVEKMMQRAADDGEIGMTMYSEDDSVQEAMATNFKARIDGYRPKTLGQRLSTLGGAYSRVSMGMFRATEQVNNQIALIASFKLFREQGLDFETAYKKAVDFNHTVNFGGGRASRPIGMFSGRSPVLRGAAMVGANLQSFVLGTVFQFFRQLDKGFFKNAKLTPGEKWAARKSVLQMFATQMAAAGTLGMPFVAGILALADKFAPDLEANKNLREWIAQLFGEDEEEGGNNLTDMAMTGLPSMLGWDMQSRMSLGNTLPGVSEYNGFQVENLMGPGANVVGQFALGAGKILRGDTSGLQSFLPNALKKPVANGLFTSVGWNEGKIKDFRDRAVLDSTPGERIGLMLGFNPKRLSDFNAASRMARASENVARNQEADFRYEQAETLLKGDFGSVMNALKSRRQESPDWDLEAGIRGIARAAEELTFPRDLRREASKSPVLRAWSIDPSLPSELQRVQLRKQIEAKFGLKPTMGRDVQMAQLMDRLREQNPQLTRSELRRLAENAVRRQPAVSLPEFQTQNP